MKTTSLPAPRDTAPVATGFALGSASLATGFAARSMLACALALWAAFQMQLEAPHWAALTVWIIAHPHPTQTWGKGFFRIVGTLIGASVAVMLTALFSQAPELLILAMSLWVGLCTAVANLLKGFHSYAAMLAGYTTLIVAVAVADRPLHAFETAVARATCVMLGVAAVAIVSAIFHRDVSQDDSGATPFRPVFHTDYRTAGTSGLRAFIAVGVAGAFWIATASPSAAGVFLLTGIMCGLFATHPAPHHASIGFGLAVMASALAAFVCLYFLIQSVETFPMLIASLAMALIPGGIAMYYPRTAFYGMGFAVNFVNQIQPANPMIYDPVTFLNNLAASITASALAALVFLIVFPRKSHD